MAVKRRNNAEVREVIDRLGRAYTYLICSQVEHLAEMTHGKPSHESIARGKSVKCLTQGLVRQKGPKSHGGFARKVRKFGTVNLSQNALCWQVTSGGRV